MKNKIISTLVYLIIFFAPFSYSLGQGEKYINSEPDSTENPNNAITILENIGTNRTFELTLSCIVIGFGLIVLGIEAYLASKGFINPDHTFKCIIITLVIIGSLLLIAAGYSNYQINGITGLLGSVAGYLLAKNEPPAK